MYISILCIVDSFQLVIFNYNTQLIYNEIEGIQDIAFLELSMLHFFIKDI